MKSTGKCKYCGCDIIFEPRADGKGFKERQVCDNCLKPSEEKEIVCNSCGKVFKIFRSKETGKFPRKILCNECAQPAKSKTFVCQKCGKSFTVTREDTNKQFSNRKLCDDCLKPAESIYRICKHCGKKFEVGRSSTSKQKQLLKRFVCDDCLKPIDSIVLKCKKCGKLFTVERSKSGYLSYDRQYCDDCLEPEIVTNICKVCGKPFTVYKRESWRKCCSEDCSNKLRKQNTNKTCIEKYGVDYPCLLPQVIDSNPSIISKINLRFAEKLKEQGIEYKQEYRLGRDYSFDFYIPECNTLIELNPTITHTTHDTGIFPAKDKNYHMNKTNFAFDSGYRCINVWDWDSWDKIINMLKPKQKLYARKLEIKKIEDKLIIDDFLDNYHLQGTCYGNTISLGLYLNSELIQIMTFGKPRYNKNYQWELLRLCTKPEYYVIGGSNKLFKYFITNYSPESIISYCDCSKFNGSVYSKLGFKQTTNTLQPREHWSIKNTKKHITAALLLQKGYDNLFKTNYGKGTDNRELMLKNGWLPVYDCGQANYVWANTRSKSFICYNI